MAEFTSQTRRKLTETWINDLKKKAAALSEREKKMVPDLYYYAIPQDVCGFMRQLLYNGKYQTLSKLYRKQFQNLVNVCVRDAHQEDFYYSLDQINTR